MPSSGLNARVASNARARRICAVSAGGSDFRFGAIAVGRTDAKHRSKDKSSEKTSEWQKTSKYDGKLYGRYGSASGVDPASLWPSHAQLDDVVAEENEWRPPLDVMLNNIAAKQKEETQKRVAKEKLIAENMAKMPKMIADWRREKRESKQKLKEEKARRDKLLAEAKERFGYTVDPRSPKFLEMVAEIEKEEKKKRKLMKRRLREEQLAIPVTPPVSSS
ncbi:large ribosomal subunit protein mL64 isoform X2 [Phycodurus eques]|uniref:large ribosomal subunit protein mL64 isoform X2 n=1 Tax=Phycodurus eques TaxID=693459 RepID=UPI002ACE21F4|nr:large ribosomal subunit protein mL64 isoform X2 [Phycodurus eques]